MTTPLKLLWLDLNASFAHTSLALPAIHAQMSHDMAFQQVEWDILSATLHMPVEQLVCRIVELKPSILCATAWLFTTEMLSAVLSRVKVLLPETIVLLGGPEFLGDNRDYLQSHRFVDAVFKGEGESSFPQWIARILSDSDKGIPLSRGTLAATVTGIAGFCFLNENNEYVDQGVAKVAAFDQLVAPEESAFFRTDKAFVQLETTRGCFNTCAFCTSGNDRPIRQIPLEEVKRRLDYYVKVGISHIRVLDRTVNSNSAQVVKLLDLFETYAGNLHFHLEVHPALLSEKLRERLASFPAGVLHLEAGIQSLRQHVLDASTRLGRLEDALSGLAFLCALPNLEVHADLIAGLPFYQLSEMKEDIATLAKLGADEIQLELLKLLPGTEMRRRADQLQLRYSPYPPYEILQSDGMSMQDLHYSRAISRMIDTYYNVPAWQQIVGRLICENESFLTHFTDWLIEKGALNTPLSLEKRGSNLFAYCKAYYPMMEPLVALAWLKAGLPLTKIPFVGIVPRLEGLAAGVISTQGAPTPIMRYYSLDVMDKEQQCWWFGYDRTISTTFPAFVGMVVV